MSDQDRGRDVSPWADADDGRADRIEAGWNMSDSSPAIPAASDSAEVAAEAERRGLGADKFDEGAGWNVGRPPATPAPRPEPPAFDTQAAAASLGADREDVGRWLRANPDVYEKLHGSGALVDAQSQGDLRGNIAAIEAFRARQETATLNSFVDTASDDAAVEAAFTAYSEGEAEPHVLADELLEGYGVAAAQKFVAAWNQDEQESFLPEPPNAAQYAQFRQAEQQVAHAATMAAMQRQQNERAASEAQAQQQQRSEALVGRMNELIADNPREAERLAPRMTAIVTELLARGDVDGTHPDLADYVYRAALAERRAETYAEAELSADEAFFGLDRAGFMGSERGLPKQQTREELVSKFLNEKIDAVPQRQPTRADREREQIASLDDPRERALDEGFATIDRIDLEARARAQRNEVRGVGRRRS